MDYCAVVVAEHLAEWVTGSDVHPVHCPQFSGSRRRPSRPPGGAKCTLACRCSAHVHDEQRLARALFGNAGGGAGLRQVEHLLADVIREELAELFGADPPPRVPEGAIVAYIVGAYLSLLSWWVSTQTPIGPRIRGCVPTAEEPRRQHAVRGRRHAAGVLVMGWSPEFYSGKHKTTGMNVQVVCSL